MVKQEKKAVNLSKRKRIRKKEEDAVSEEEEVEVKPTKRKTAFYEEKNGTPQPLRKKLKRKKK